MKLTNYKKSQQKSKAIKKLRDLGLSDEQLFDLGISPRSYWDETRILKIVTTCSTQNDFRTKFPKLYAKAQRFGFLNKIRKILPRHIPLSQINKKHTIDHIFETVEKCKSVKEFRTKYKGEYCEAQRLGILQIFSDVLEVGIEHGKITEKYIRQVSKKFYNKTEFARKEPGAYEKAKKLGIFLSVTNHMEDRSQKRVIRSDGKIFESTSSASISLGRARNAVSKAIIGGRKCGGYRWAYCDAKDKVLK